jgi:hypothetical protein
VACKLLISFSFFLALSTSDAVGHVYVCVHFNGQVGCAGRLLRLRHVPLGLSILTGTACVLQAIFDEISTHRVTDAIV